MSERSFKRYFHFLCLVFDTTVLYRRWFLGVLCMLSAVRASYSQSAVPFLPQRELTPAHLSSLQQQRSAVNCFTLSQLCLSLFPVKSTRASKTAWRREIYVRVSPYRFESRGNEWRDRWDFEHTAWKWMVQVWNMKCVSKPADWSYARWFIQLVWSYIESFNRLSHFDWLS